MASMQKTREEERAEDAAHKAADELAAARREGLSDTAGAGSPRRGGILGSVQDSARSLLGAVRDTFSSSSPGAAGEDKLGAAGEDKLGAGYAAQKAEEGKEKARDMAGAAAGKAAEAKDAAAGKAESAREYVAGAKEDARRPLAGDAKASKGETNESAWQQGQDVRRRAAEKADEERRGTHEAPSKEEKGRSATENIYGAAQGVTEAFKEKMTMPEDVVEQKRAEASGKKATATPAATKTSSVDEEEDVMMRVKAADQMTGQAFNDVGKMGEEGTGMGRR